MVKLLIIISTTLFFLACGNSGEIKRDVKLLQSKNILFPSDIEILIKGKDTVINDFMDSQLKLVVYTDSTGCSSCSINQFHRWNNLLSYAEGFNNRLKYYFIFSPKKNDVHSIKFELRTALFDYPVILDSKSEFEKLNPHLPKNKALHTFLLDKDNNVILVGSPLGNPAIEKLFKTMTADLLDDKQDI